MRGCRTRSRVLMVGLGLTMLVGLASAWMPALSNARLSATTTTEVSVAMGEYPPVSLNARWWLDGSYPPNVFSDHECSTRAADGESVHCGIDRHVKQNYLEHAGPETKVPTLKADAINGRAALNFSHAVLKGDDRFGTTVKSASIFLVFREHERTAPEDKAAVLMNLNGEAHSKRFSIIGPHWDGYIYFDSGSYAANSSFARSKAPAMDVGEITLVTAWKDQNRDVSGLQVNDGDPYCSTGNPAAEMGGGLRMGDYAHNTDIAELIIFSYRLPDAKEQHIENYLADKWGIALAKDRGSPSDGDCYTPPLSAGR